MVIYGKTKGLLPTVCGFYRCSALGLLSLRGKGRVYLPARSWLLPKPCACRAAGGPERRNVLYRLVHWVSILYRYI